MNRLTGLQKTVDNERAENSKQVSTIVRTLGTTVIAVAWLFSGASVRSDHPTVSTLHVLENDSTLRCCVLAALIALAADIGQYLISTLLWSPYRWAVDAVDINDHFEPARPHEIATTARIGWAILRLFRTAYRLEYELDLAPTGGWQARRRALRQKLAESEDDLAVPMPAWMNLPGTLLFFAKVVALGIAWFELFCYLAHT